LEAMKPTYLPGEVVSAGLGAVGVGTAWVALTWAVGSAGLGSGTSAIGLGGWGIVTLAATSPEEGGDGVIRCEVV
jgi:hypothetical protein